MSKKQVEEFKIQITDEYLVRRSQGGFIFEFESANAVRKRVKGEMKETRETCSGFYGTLHQALKAFVVHYYGRSNSLEEVKERIQEAMGIINPTMEAMNSVNQALVEKYKTVKVSEN